MAFLNFINNSLFEFCGCWMVHATATTRYVFRVYAGAVSSMSVHHAACSSKSYFLTPAQSCPRGVMSWGAFFTPYQCWVKVLDRRVGEKTQRRASTTGSTWSLCCFILTSAYQIFAGFRMTPRVLVPIIPYFSLCINRT